MSFKDILKRYEDFNFNDHFSKVTLDDIDNSLKKDKLSENDLLNLLSPVAAERIEKMAQLSHKKTIQYFGRTISLYIPLYISNYCSNGCTYCGFHAKSNMKRKKLSLSEIEEQAIIISKTGIKHILFLTGESEEATPVSFLVEVVQLLKKYFPSISIEIFPLSVKDYTILKEAGVDGLTVYQEVYDRKVYKEVHPYGMKSDYDFRIETPERGAKAGFRLVNVGALFGLSEIASEAFFTAMHAKYLDDKYPDTEIAVSFPRINSAENEFEQKHRLDDKTFVQYLTAFRLFLPRVGINISTRETAEFRDNVLPLGVTRFSAGSKTEVGGYGEHDVNDVPQFDISDTRTVAETVKMIEEKGFQAVMKDWELM
ncbi:MAG: 2-iminoacetate synthase ThiH [Candidatus Delongbacteria bacterium]|nr:2-iminoacetate synthase ThiH [Candidatus Delongbacteria bacterium]